MPVQNRFPTIKKATTFNGRDIKLYNGTGDSKAPMDLTGVSIKLEFRSAPASLGGSVIFRFTTADNSIIITGSGVARMVSRIMNVPRATYESDLVLTFPNGTIKNYAQLYWIVN